VQFVRGGMLYQQVREEPSSEDCKVEATELDVGVDRGAFAGDRVVFRHMSSQMPGQIPGHVTVTLRARDEAGEVHDGWHWQRRGNDLHLKLELSLRESLLGFRRRLKHLDGHIVEFATESITRPGQVIRIEGEGMPLKDVPSQFGNLDFIVSVVYPPSFTDEERAELASVGALQRHHNSMAGSRKASDEL